MDDYSDTMTAYVAASVVEVIIDIGAPFVG
jgi:hypothetical protein